MVEHHSGEGKMSDEEYERNLWSEDQVRPEAGGHSLSLGWSGPGTCDSPGIGIPAGKGNSVCYSAACVKM
jgi:hypothetical protein